MILALALIVVEAARMAHLPPPLLGAVAELRGGDPLALADELRAQGDLVFSRYADLREDRLSDWHEAVMLSCPDPEFRQAAPYAAEVYRLLRDGQPAAGLEPQEVEVPWPLDERRFLGAASFSEGREGLRPSSIVIHDTEESFDDTLRIFLEPSSRASAHFTIRAADGAVTQHVAATDTAWHAANWTTNLESIGVEHEGFADSRFPDQLYRASAALVRFLCDRFGIPEDRNHILGHYEVPDPFHPGWYGGAGHHSDPCGDWAGEPGWHNNAGCRWDWDRYLAMVRGASTH